MNLIQFILLAAGLLLSLVWVVHSRVPQAVAIKLRDAALDLEEILRYRRGINR
jgi:hypothetical protein